MTDPFLRPFLSNQVEINDATRDALMEDAKRFYRAGGVVTLADWSDLGSVTKVILAAAHEEVGQDIAAEIERDLKNAMVEPKL